ncbi:tyrosine-type recombinase/integrase [Nocardioides acrostichi]|uniref:Site-specific integrase n=1 Tax=Nocardioides acrostichi TaxID=2784339 RepID=A0A930Y803_9ACTN|nr:site-specific integrase [Nocardioides acrostichi]MBF4162592.1 site-specific integrase [Nocardioides acrostichi]
MSTSMARPRTTIGTSGTITVVAQVCDESGRWVTAPAGTKPQRYRARTKYRDRDGKLRDVERFDSTKAKAEQKLKAALVERQAPSTGGAGLTSNSTLGTAVAHWLEQQARPESDLSQNSLDQYRGTVKRYVTGSRVENLTLREVNRVAVLEDWLQSVADEHGAGSAKSARSVVSGVLSMAVRYDLLDTNAIREVRPAKAKKRRGVKQDKERALTRKERDAVLAAADEHESEHHLDVADVVWWMAGTGVRIGEALGQQWDDVSLADGTVLVRGTKTESSTRVLTLPPWLAERMRGRAARTGTSGHVFASPGRWGVPDTTKPRDRRNLYREMRAIFDAAGCDWATSHTLRRTVASLIEQSGGGIELAARVLGHSNPAMTASVYLNRKADTSAAAEYL